MPGTFESVVKCDIPPVKNYFLDADNNDACKYILMSILNVLFLEFILCIVLVLSKILQAILFSHYYLLQNALICPL